MDFRKRKIDGGQGPGWDGIKKGMKSCGLTQEGEGRMLREIR